MVILKPGKTPDKAEQTNAERLPLVIACLKVVPYFTLLFKLCVSGLSRTDAKKSDIDDDIALVYNIQTLTNANAYQRS